MSAVTMVSIWRPREKRLQDFATDIAKDEALSLLLQELASGGGGA